MKKIFKWLGIVLGALVLILLIAGGALFLTGNRKLSAGAYDEIQAAAVEIPTDEAAIARGEHIATAISLCVDCHGENLGGQVFEDDPSFVTIYTPNLTTGSGGVGATNTDADWVLALRHGVGHDGRGLAFMPSAGYTFMSDEDLGALIAYLKSVPPVDQEVPARKFGPPAIILTALGAFPLMPDLIDHTATPTTPAMEVTESYGAYLVSLGACRDCHGPELTGQTDPNAPQGPNISPSGEVGNWSQADFVTAIRTGTIPSGRTLSDLMPWKSYGNMTDEELQAIYLYLHSLPTSNTP